ncbi:MAG: membrane protein insertion efficiency factor YidD [Pseudomonadota bacterium]
MSTNKGEPLRRLALWSIRLYQKHLSPHKGFVCAFRVHTGRDSCSAYGYRVIARHGLLSGLILLRRRLRRCSERHARHAPARQPSALRRQAGFCDVPCDIPCDAPCELPELPCAGDAASGAADVACDVLSSCGCDFPSRQKKDRK